MKSKTKKPAQNKVMADQSHLWMIVGREISEAIRDRATANQLEERSPTVPEIQEDAGRPHHLPSRFKQPA